MKPGPAISGLLAQIVNLQPPDDFGRDFPRRLAQLFAQRHGAVGLIIAEFRVLAGANLRQQLGRIIGQAGQGRFKPSLNFAKDVHEEWLGAGG